MAKKLRIELEITVDEMTVEELKEHNDSFDPDNESPADYLNDASASEIAMAIADHATVDQSETLAGSEQWVKLSHASVINANFTSWG